MASRRTSPGGRFGARRTVVLLSILAAVLVPGTRLGASGEPDPPAAVRVEEKDGVYAVSACFRVPQSPDAVRAVLTDYENIPRFMSGVRTSVVIERAPGHVTVEQEAVSRLMMFSKHVHLLLDIVEGPDSLRFQDRSGRSFRRYEGSWTIAGRTGAMTQVSYALVAEPSFDVPQLILKRLLSRDSGVMIDGLRQEIAARALRQGGDGLATRH